MQKEEIGKKPRRSPPAVRGDDQQLLLLLIQEASKRGETLSQLAKSLGVTYRRLAQWRRGEARIENASRSVFERAARYLGIPPIFVLVHAQVVRLEDFAWPELAQLESAVTREIQRMELDPLVGPFVPERLASAHSSIRLFVVFLFHEVERATRTGATYIQWLDELRKASSSPRKAPT